MSVSTPSLYIESHYGSEFILSRGVWVPSASLRNILNFFSRTQGNTRAIPAFLSVYRSSYEFQLLSCGERCWSRVCKWFECECLWVERCTCMHSLQHHPYVQNLLTFGYATRICTNWSVSVSLITHRNSKKKKETEYVCSFNSNRTFASADALYTRI